MAVVVDDLLRDFVGSGPEDDASLAADLAAAIVLVDGYVSANQADPAAPVSPPTEILDRAYREVCSDLFNRRKAPNGILNQQYSTVTAPSSAPIRISRDPLAPAYPLLARWLPPIGFA